MHFTVYLPIAGTSVNILLLMGLGGVVGLLSGLFGVGGGFLLTPLLIMIGIPPTVAAASDANQIVAASTSGTYAHAKGGTVDFKMGVLLLVGGIVGSTFGVKLIRILSALGEANFVITVTYVVMLGSIGGYMLYESITEIRKKGVDTGISDVTKKPSAYADFMNSLPFKTEFVRSKITISMITPLFFGTMVGVLSALMGVGGGFIMVPVMVYLLRMPMHVVVGTSLFQIMFTCVNVTVMQAWINHNVDFILALLLLLGSTSGAQVGSRLVTKLKTDQLKILMSVIVLAVMVKMLVGLLVTPDILVSYKGGH